MGGTKMTGDYSTRYLDELTRMRCAPELLSPRRKLFPNAKEITESFGAFEAARRYFRDWFALDDVTVACVGDGHRPRTGATFALRTSWNVLSIDPALKNPRSVGDIRRLECNAKKVQDCVPRHFGRLLVVAVHSHATLAQTMSALSGDEVGVIAIPCCVPLDIDRKPIATYRDSGIMSPHNTVRVWRWGTN
jgi:hypothetical protein